MRLLSFGKLFCDLFILNFEVYIATNGCLITGLEYGIEDGME